MRALSQAFMHDLLNLDGLLHPILERVEHDHTLMLAIRDGYINIYYRGGNILRVKEQNNSSYSAFFDNKYNKSGMPSPSLPDAIESQHAARAWVGSFQGLKGIMDFYFSEYSKPEREFQQLVARENGKAQATSECLATRSVPPCCSSFSCNASRHRWRSLIHSSYLSIMLSSLLAEHRLDGLIAVVNYGCFP